MKITQFLLTLIACTIIWQNQAWAKKENEYYRHLKFRETPYSKYQGIHPIDKKQAKKTAHYRFEYDEKNRVTAISHMIGNQIINDNSNWDTFIWFAPKVTMEYQANSETHHYYDTKNQKISAHGDVYTASYVINDQGKRVELRFFDENKQPSENAWGIHHYQWQHLSETELIEKRFDLKKQQMPIRPVFKFYETHMTFDHQQQIRQLKNFGVNGTPSNNDSGAGIDRIFYDFQGNFQRWHVYDKDGKPVEGNRPMVHIGEHLYDSLGNKIGMRGFDKQGNPMKFSWGDFLIKKKYNTFGKQTEARLYDENMELSNLIKLEYTKNGLQRKWVKNYNAQGQLAASPDFGGAAAIQFIYDGNDVDVTERISYDENLNPIKQ